ncbi:MAG: S-layer homology domain-containing protein [Clostridia bacterium]|nr:S-layer homology domain-containing protein [Clostridia bacterium]
MYKDGYVIVNTDNISGTFTIKEVKKSFSDVKADWAVDAVSALAARNVINGVGDDTYEPDRTVTRAEFVKMIVTMFNVGDASATASFADVSSSDWYAPYVAAAQKLGITTGYAEDNTFRPNNTISREEMSAMLYRAADVLSVSMTSTTASSMYIDDSSIQSYAKAAVYKMQEAGILKGVGDNMFDAKGNCTRAQAAVAIYNMFKASMTK